MSISKLEMAYELLGDVIERRNHHRKRVEAHKVNRYGRDEWWHRYQMEQQLVMVRRLIQEGKSEL